MTPVRYVGGREDLRGKTALARPAVTRGSKGLTPLHLMLLLHYHTTPEPWPQATAPAVRVYTEHLLRLELIQRDPKEIRHESYDITQRGIAFVESLCTAPLPVERWVIPNQEERTV